MCARRAPSTRRSRAASPSGDGSCCAGFAEFRGSPAAEGWRRLPFFADGTADDVAARVDERIAAGTQVLPPPHDIFTGLRLAPLERVKAVILGQDLSDAGRFPRARLLVSRPGPPLRLLRVIFDEVAADLGVPRPRSGDLRRGRTGRAVPQHGSHGRGGPGGVPPQDRLVDPRRRSTGGSLGPAPGRRLSPVGGPARKRAILVDGTKYLVIESGHPSPLNRLNDSAERALQPRERMARRKGEEPIDWRL